LTEATFNGKKNLEEMSVRKYTVMKKAPAIVRTICSFKGP
jgi:hypothetical protein